MYKPEWLPHTSYGKTSSINWMWFLLLQTRNPEWFHILSILSPPWSQSPASYPSGMKMATPRMNILSRIIAQQVLDLPTTPGFHWWVGNTDLKWKQPGHLSSQPPWRIRGSISLKRELIIKSREIQIGPVAQLVFWPVAHAHWHALFEAKPGRERGADSLPESNSVVDEQQMFVVFPDISWFHDKWAPLLPAFKYAPCADPLYAFCLHLHLLASPLVSIDFLPLLFALTVSLLLSRLLLSTLQPLLPETSLPHGFCRPCCYLVDSTDLNFLLRVWLVLWSLFIQRVLHKSCGLWPLCS